MSRQRIQRKRTPGWRMSLNADATRMEWRYLPIGPDCDAAKHRACSGQALDETTDEIVACTCACHQEDQ